MEPDLESFDGPLPLFPLPRFALLPHTSMPLHIIEPRYRRLLRDTMKDQGVIGMVQFAGDWENEPFETPRIHPIGCAGRVTNLAELPDGRFNLLLQGVGKFEVRAEIRSDPYRAARIRWVEDRNETASGPAADETTERLRVLLDEASRARQEEPVARSILAPGLSFAARVNRLVLASRVDQEDFTVLLELRDVYARARRLERILTRRMEARLRVKRFRKLVPDDPRSN